MGLEEEEERQEERTKKNKHPRRWQRVLFHLPIGDAGQDFHERTFLTRELGSELS
jgi:hypothetical protein